LTVESEEEDSAAKAVAADLRSSGPQRSIHTAAERQQHSLHLQQAITARSSVMDASVTPSPAFEFNSLSSAAVAAANAETSEVNRRDIFRAIGISGVACVLAGVLDHEWVEAHKVSTDTPAWQQFSAPPTADVRPLVVFGSRLLCHARLHCISCHHKRATASKLQCLPRWWSSPCSHPAHLPTFLPAGPLHEPAVHPGLHRHLC
jgi:hypothetical protein